MASWSTSRTSSTATTPQHPIAPPLHAEVTLPTRQTSTSGHAGHYPIRRRVRVEGAVRDLRNGAVTVAVPGETGPEGINIQTCINAAAGPCTLDV